jgi:translation initiation factor IF-1
MGQTPETVSHGSSAVFTWECERGHRWDEAVDARTRYKVGGECRQCQSLAELYPDIARQFVADAEEKGRTPETVMGMSAARFTWECESGHRWDAEVNDRTRRSDHGCPQCRWVPEPGQSLAELYPDIARQFVADAEGKGRTPETVVGGSKVTFTWECERGHRWDEAIRSRTRRIGGGCRQCRSLAELYPDIARQFVADAEGKGRSPETVSFGSNARFEWECEFGHRWKAKVFNRTLGGNCPECFHLRRAGKGQSLALKLHIAKQQPK